MTRNQNIVRAVYSGLSYSEAAERLGVTRNTVAGVKTFGIRPKHEAKRVRALSAWHRANPDVVRKAMIRWHSENPERSKDRIAHARSCRKS